MCPNVIVIGHRKTAASVENSTAIEPESLDLTGKLKNVIMAGCDAIGYVYRNDKEELMVSFKANDAIEAGSRCPHLKGKDVKFQWNNIYKEKK